MQLHLNLSVREAHTTIEVDRDVVRIGEDDESLHAELLAGDVSSGEDECARQSLPPVLGMGLDRLVAAQATSVGDDAERSLHHAVDECAEILAVPGAHELARFRHPALHELAMLRSFVLVDRETPMASLVTVTLAPVTTAP